MAVLQYNLPTIPFPSTLAFVQINAPERLKIHRVIHFVFHLPAAVFPSCLLTYSVRLLTRPASLSTHIPVLENRHARFRSQQNSPDRLFLHRNHHAVSNMWWSSTTDLSQLRALMRVQGRGRVPQAISPHHASLARWHELGTQAPGCISPPPITRVSSTSQEQWGGR